jgi:hypothetical protein
MDVTEPAAMRTYREAMRRGVAAMRRRRVVER